MLVFYGLHSAIDFRFMDYPAQAFGIAIVHTVFNLFSTCLLLPFTEWLEKLACLTIKDVQTENVRTRHVDEDAKILDERFLNNPAFAMEQCRRVSLHMAVSAKECYMNAVDLLHHYDNEKADEVSLMENDIDRYEDMIGTYLLKLSGRQLAERDSRTLMLFLECIGDFERISDHAVGIKEALKQMQEKKKEFSNKAQVELDIYTRAVANILETTLEVFDKEDAGLCMEVESLLQVITELGAEVKRRHIKRLRKGKCTIELGFMLSDIVTGAERVAVHCSHIAASVMELQEDSLGIHEYRDAFQKNETEQFQALYRTFQGKYVLP